MARYYGLPQSTSFNTSVISATWDEKELMWRVLTEDVKTGTQKMWTCRVVHLSDEFPIDRLAYFSSRTIFATKVRQYPWRKRLQG
jgi:hypothetical protein